MMQNSKCEPVLTEAQAETEEWAVSASITGVNQALIRVVDFMQIMEHLFYFMVY